MRQRVGTTPDGTIVLTSIADILLRQTGHFKSALDPFSPFIGRQIVDVSVLQGLGDAVLNTFGMTGA